MTVVSKRLSRHAGNLASGIAAALFCGVPEIEDGVSLERLFGFLTQSGPSNHSSNSLLPE
jgi:hypothetical protein